jgi:hypothetical protein
MRRVKLNTCANPSDQLLIDTKAYSEIDGCTGAHSERRKVRGPSQVIHNNNIDNQKIYRIMMISVYR